MANNINYWSFNTCDLSGNSIDCDWIHCRPSSEQSHILDAIEIEENTGETRQVILKYKQKGSNFQEELLVTQKGTLTLNTLMKNPNCAALIYAYPINIGDLKHYSIGLGIDISNIKKAYISTNDGRSSYNISDDKIIPMKEINLTATPHVPSSGNVFNCFYITNPSNYINSLNGVSKTILILELNNPESPFGLLSAFTGNYLDGIVFPDACKTITNSFDKSYPDGYVYKGLTKIVVGKNVTDLNGYCFANKPNLKDIYFRNPKAPKLIRDFSGFTFVSTYQETTNSGVTIHIPSDASGFGDSNDSATISEDDKINLMKWPGCLNSGSTKIGDNSFSTAGIFSSQILINNLKKTSTWTFKREDVPKDLSNSFVDIFMDPDSAYYGEDF